MLNAIFTHVITGWIWRRAQEVGSFAAWATPFWLAVPDVHKETIYAILRGEGGFLSVSTYAGLAWYVWTQFQSFKATTRPQVVTADGVKQVVKSATAKADVKTVAKEEAKRAPTTLIEKITEALGRKAA